MLFSLAAEMLLLLLLLLAALTGCSHWLLWCEAGGVRLVV
jgi:hypothetical protein